MHYDKNTTLQNSVVFLFDSDSKRYCQFAGEQLSVVTKHKWEEEIVSFFAKCWLEITFAL